MRLERASSSELGWNKSWIDKYLELVINA